MPLGEDIPLEREHQRGVPLRNCYFAAMILSSMRMVTDRHRLAACHNKHCVGKLSEEELTVAVLWDADIFEAICV